MNLSVEISMYPLQEDYKSKIKVFLSYLSKHANSEIEIRTSNMSTRVFGEYDAVSNLLSEAMKQSMRQYGKIVFVCKYLEGDARQLSDYD
jgi:uncharacterized protein YqgV (UPF0045/DUF77 family)